MSRPFSFRWIFIEAAAYAIIGSALVMTVVLLPDCVADLHTPPSAGPQWIADNSGLSYPAPGGMLPGLFISVVIVRIVLCRITESRLVYWAVVQSMAAILSIAIQLAVVTPFYHWPLIFQDGYWHEPAIAVGKLFLLLTPFTIAFAVAMDWVTKRDVKNSLK